MHKSDVFPVYVLSLKTNVKNDRNHMYYILNTILRDTAFVSCLYTN